MDIANLLISLVSGAVGGNATGAAFKNLTLGTIGNTVAGLVGGAAGGYIMQAVGLLNTMGLSDISVGSLIGNIGSSAVAGGVLTAIIGFIKKAMSK